MVVEDEQDSEQDMMEDLGTDEIDNKPMIAATSVGNVDNNIDLDLNDDKTNNNYNTNNNKSLNLQSSAQSLTKNIMTGFSTVAGSVSKAVTNLRNSSSAVARENKKIELLEKANCLIQDSSFNTMGPPPIGVSDFAFGWRETMKIPQQDGLFLRLNVEIQHLTSGFVINIVGNNIIGGKFKMIILNNRGEIVLEKQSYKEKSEQIVKFHAPFHTYTIEDNNSSTSSSPSSSTSSSPIKDSSENNININNNNNDKIPKVFNKLQNFNKDTFKFDAGRYLMILCQDGLSISKPDVSISIFPLQMTCDASSFQDTEEKLFSLKKEVDGFKDEYIAAERAYNLAKQRAKELDNDVTKLLQQRQNSYSTYLDTTASAYLPDDQVSGEESPSMLTKARDSIGAAASTAAITAKIAGSGAVETLGAASASVSAGAGALANKFSSLFASKTKTKEGEVVDTDNISNDIITNPINATNTDTNNNIDTENNDIPSINANADNL